MWDLLIITAGTIGQKEDFELFLQQMDLTSFTKSWVVMSDDPPEFKIGSGGCMFSIISRLKVQYGQDLLTKKILLIHSGGLSQRMPHLSCYGKVFAYLPGGKTILELKLKSYKTFPSILRPGLLVAASDVLEDTANFREVKDSDMILFANQSSLKTACQHGVFVLDNDGKLQSVLQKPTEAQIIAHNAVRPDGSVLTDCFYWMNWSICEKLADLYSPTLREEICCYGDFMRPLGSKPCLSYLSEGTMELQLYRQRLSSIFAGTKEELIDLGPQSFYHFGTIEEFLQHIDENSIFSKKFSIEHDENVYSNIKNCKIEKGCYVEYSDISNIQISSNCIVSSIRSSGGMVIPENSVVFTICTKRGYVTILFHTHDDIKKKEEHLMWMEKDTGLKRCSLWNAAIFPIRESRQSSLEATLSMVSTFIFEVRKSGAQRIFTHFWNINRIIALLRFCHIRRHLLVKKNRSKTNFEAQECGYY